MFKGLVDCIRKRGIQPNNCARVTPLGWWSALPTASVRPTMAFKRFCARHCLFTVSVMGNVGFEVYGVRGLISQWVLSIGKVFPSCLVYGVILGHVNLFPPGCIFPAHTGFGVQWIKAWGRGLGRGLEGASFSIAQETRAIPVHCQTGTKRRTESLEFTILAPCVYPTSLPIPDTHFSLREQAAFTRHYLQQARGWGKAGRSPTLRPKPLL